MSERFFSSRPITTSRVTLEGAEAHHLLRVMRATKGQSVTLFDDSGAEFSAVVETLGRSSVELSITSRHEVNRELPFLLVVGVALPKGDRQKWLVEKLAELGVTSLVPLITEHGVAQPTAGALDRLRRTAIEAAKQCGRNRLMMVHAAQRWQDWISRPTLAGDQQPGEQRRLMAHPGGAPIQELDWSVASAMHLAIGPEGGLTAAEVAGACAADWQMVDLGPRVLRVETAAVALVSTVTLGGIVSRSLGSG